MLSNSKIFFLSLFSFCLIGGVWGNLDIYSYGVKAPNLDSSTGDAEIYSKIHTLLRDFAFSINPNIVEGVKTKSCKAHVQEWFTYISKEISEETIWAWHMLDAWGKFPAGILSGHINAQGDFSECVQVKASNVSIENPEFLDVEKNFEGKYCNMYLLPEISGLMEKPLESVLPGELIELISIREGFVLTPSIGTCFPSSCTDEDVTILMGNALNAFFQNFNTTPVFSHALRSCYLEKKPDFDAGDITVIVILCLLALTALVAGVVDMGYRRRMRNKEPQRKSIAFQSLLSFSFYTNTEKWLKVSSGGESLDCLNGIRVLSTSWIVLGHTWYMLTFLPVWNMVDLKKSTYEDFFVQCVLNGTFSVDTFFVLSGLLVTFNLLKALQKQNGRFNLLLFYVYRYIRITPAYFILLGVMATLIPYLGSGPYWDVMERWGQFCETNWWTNILYVNNFVNTSYLCQGEAWYLANDMQFYIVSPFFIIPLFKWEMIGIILLVVATVLSSLCPALLVHFNETVPTTIGTRDSAVWFLDIYIKPYARIQTYFVGMWLGYILYKTRGKKITLPYPVVALGWTLSTVIALTVLYGMYPYFDPREEMDRVDAFFYALLARFSWGVSLGWIIFACIHGYGGIINDFLSWSLFIPLARICFCVFLVSLHLQMILHLGSKQVVTYDYYTMVNYFFAHMMMSFIVGWFCTLLMETPFMNLKKVLLEGGERPPRKVDDQEPTPK